MDIDYFYIWINIFFISINSYLKMYLFLMMNVYCIFNFCFVVCVYLDCKKLDKVLELIWYGIVVYYNGVVYWVVCVVVI